MSCPSGKRRYRDHIGAQFALAVIRHRRTDRRRETRAYPCPICHGWHLTSRTAISPNAAKPRRKESRR